MLPVFLYLIFVDVADSLCVHLFLVKHLHVRMLWDQSNLVLLGLYYVPGMPGDCPGSLSSPLGLTALQRVPCEGGGLLCAGLCDEKI